MRKRGVLVLVMLGLVVFSGQPAHASEITWTPVVAGIEYATFPLGERSRGDILVTRIDPAAVMFRVYYQAGQHQTIEGWARKYPGAAVIINANYFRSRIRPIGLVQIGPNILNPATGRTDTGVFEVRDEVPSILPIGPTPTINPVTNKPYIERFEAYPFLITNGETVTRYAAESPMAAARRTIVAQDGQGHILFIIASPIELTLPEMVNWLKNSGLGIVTALNLDGGSSSQIHLASGNFPQLERGAAVPVVLAVFPR